MLHDDNSLLDAVRLLGQRAAVRIIRVSQKNTPLRVYAAHTTQTCVELCPQLL